MSGALPPTKQFLGLTLPQLPDYEIREHVASGHNGHLFRAVNETTKKVLAFKVVPVRSRGGTGSETYLREATTPNVLQTPYVLKCLHVAPYRQPGTDADFRIFVSEFVDGPDLRRYVQEHKKGISIPFVEECIRTLLRVLYELREKDLNHGDLHDRNILVSTPRYDPYQQITFLVTDFGVRDVSEATGHTNDYLALAIVLKKLLQEVDYNTCSSRDRFVFNVLNNDFLGRHLIDQDTSLDPLVGNPGRLLEKLDSMDDMFSQARGGTQPRLRSPFEYPNCEQIGQSATLLGSLYSDRMLGLDEIERRANLVVTGPRGCGKTTVFRALSLEHRIAMKAAMPGAVDYIGIYYRCDDLYFVFPQYRHPDRADAADLPVHFLAAELMASAMEQVRVWAAEHFPREFRGQQSRVIGELLDLLGWSDAGDPSVHTWGGMVARFRNTERKRAARIHRELKYGSKRLDGVFGPRTLIDFCRVLCTRLAFLRDRPFYFFVDDYSHPKVTTALQENLNRMLMHRSASVFFKISTESPISFSARDVDGKEYVESREYDEVNLGLRYLATDSDKIQAFLEDLFGRRFRQAREFPVKSLRELLGSRARNENAVALSFRTKQKDEYAGIEAVTAMCTGDIHYIIGLVARMVEDQGGVQSLRENKGTPRIADHQQNASIRRASSDFLDSFRTLPKWGHRLSEVVAAIGTVAHSFLRHRNSGNETGSPPHQASRLEPYGALRLSSEANRVLEALLRYSILIEDPRGKSMRGHPVRRFYLRRYLIPRFLLTFSLRDSLRLENEDIELLLRFPRRFEEVKTLKSADEAVRVDGRKVPARHLFSSNGDPDHDASST